MEKQKEQACTTNKTKQQDKHINYTRFRTQKEKIKQLIYLEKKRSSKGCRAYVKGNKSKRNKKTLCQLLIF
jgi:hypothetical protein